MSIPISLKWGKVSYNDQLSIQPGTSARSFKLKVQSLTGVPLARQKLLCPKVWKGALKDDVTIIMPDSKNIKIPKGKTSIVVTLIGSAEALVEKSPEERPQFAEDMTPEELWKATRSKNNINVDEEGNDNNDDDDDIVVDIVALQKEAGMDRDDGKMEMYQYDRLVTGLPQHQINDMLVSRKEETSCDAATNKTNAIRSELEDTTTSKSTSTSILSSSKPLLGEVAMTMGMELRRAYINSLAVLPNSGTIVSGLDDGHVQLWHRGQLVKDARHSGARVDHVLAFPSSTSTAKQHDHDPSFVTAGDGSICLWTEEGEQLMQFGSFPGTSPAAITVGSVVGEVGKNIKYLAACFRITRQVDPNQFRLVPQNEAERQRREAAEVREQTIQNELLRASKLVKVWTYDASQSGTPGVVRGDVISPANDAIEETASVTNLLDMNGKLVCGDAWGGIRIIELTQSSTSGSNNNPSFSQQQHALLQFRGHSIACMEQVEERLLAVAIQPEHDAGILPFSTQLHASSPRGIYIINTEQGTLKAVLVAHTDTVQCICRLPDGILSAGGKMDATVRFWDLLDDDTTSANSDASDAEVKVVTEAKIMKQPGYVFDIKVLPDSKGSNVYAIAAARYNVIKIVI